MPGRLVQLGRIEPGRLRELERLQVVVGEHLGLLLGASERLDPRRRSLMLVRSRRTRDLAVGDIADEHVAERVLALARDRGACETLDELLALERVQQLLGLPACDAVDGFDRAEPEHLADDGRVLEQPLLLLGEGVEPGGDDSLHRLGQLEHARPARGGTRVLLGVERVAAGPRE